MNTWAGEAELVQGALQALQHATGLRAQIAESSGRHIVIESDDQRTFKLTYCTKQVIDRRDQLAAHKTLHGDAMLITRAISHAMAEHCRELNIQFADHAGNCYLQQPGLFVFITGLKAAVTEKSTMTRGLTPAALRVMLAVLTHPAILNGSVRQIAEAASISHGAAGTALNVLEQAGYFSTTNTRGRTLAMPERWLDTWTEGYLGRIRPKLEKRTMTTSLTVQEMLDRITPSMHEVTLGGETAAAYRKLGLKPGMLTLYVNFGDPNVLRQLVRELKLHRDVQGEVELISMFWNTNALSSFPAVPDALIYADLIGAGDARTMEVASSLRKEICHYVESET